MTRRHFFGRSARGLGAAALASLLPERAAAATATGGLPGLPHFAPKARRAIYLFMNGGPSQMETGKKGRVPPHSWAGPALSCRAASL
jgi:hypothetical protein